mgnify:CR=1 FL=1
MCLGRVYVTYSNETEKRSDLELLRQSIMIR